jgi:hypothetical protein
MRAHAWTPQEWHDDLCFGLHLRSSKPVLLAVCPRQWHSIHNPRKDYHDDVLKAYHIAVYDVDQNDEHCNHHIDGADGIEYARRHQVALWTV